ncbi:MAG: class I SAM-dependent methyltransferase [Halobacteriales archaeon]
MGSPGAAGNAVDRFYTRWASAYDLLASAAPGIGTVRRRAIDALKIDPGDTVVEMGCGTGANFPHLRAAVGPEGAVIGVDLAGGVLDRAQSRIDRAGWENVALVRGDATRPALQEADALLATFVVGMFDDPERVVDRWCDLLGSGGRITLLNARRSTHRAAGPLNLAFRGFVRLAAPGNRLSRDSPTRDLERSILRAQESLRARCGRVDRETLAGGYLTLASGRVSQ